MTLAPGTRVGPYEIKAEPAWSELPATAPAPIRRLLRRCLERNPRNRQHDIADARIVIEEALAGSDEMATPAVVPATVSGRGQRRAMTVFVFNFEGGKR